MKILSTKLMTAQALHESRGAASICYRLHRKQFSFVAKRQSLDITYFPFHDRLPQIEGNDNSRRSRTVSPPCATPWRPGVQDMILRREEFALCFFKNQTGQATAGECAGIDADAVGTQSRGLGDTVPVDDDLAEIEARLKEFVADPKHVFRNLMIERDTWPDARMHEGIIALDMHERQTVEKRAMFDRELACEFALCALEFLFVCDDSRRSHAVAVKRGVAAIGEPLGADLFVFEEAEEAIFVISLEVHGFEAGEGVAEQKIDHAARVRSPIDIIAKINDDLALGAVRRSVFSHLPKEIAQRAQTAMNVADGIKARPGGNLRA